MAQTIDNVVIVSHGKLRAQGTLESITSGIAQASMHARTPEADRLCAVLTEAKVRFRRLSQDLVAVDGMTPEQLGRPRHQPDHSLRADQSGRRPGGDLPVPHLGARLRGIGVAGMINTVRSELLKMRTMPGSGSVSDWSSP